MKHFLFILVLSFAAPGAAAADSFISTMGARVGGYGFREATSATGDDKAGTGWQACRMNGLGVFANHRLNETFFIEGGLDTYSSDSFPTGQASSDYDTPIDRVSGLLAVAVGARFFPESIVSPYVQLGVGGELTRVRLPALGMEDTALLPMGFFGVGASIRLSDHIRAGATLRVNAMGYYDDAQFRSELGPEAELATQAQFFAAYEL